MKTPRIQRVTVSPLTAPLVEPFRIATGVHRRLDNLLVQIELSDGTAGFGEAAVAAHITGETVSRTRANLRREAGRLAGQPFAAVERICADVRERLAGNMAAAAGLEMALLDAHARRKGVPLWRLFGRRPRRLVTDITVVIAPLARTEAAVRRWRRRGFTRFKVKVGKDFDLDVKRVVAVRRLVPAAEILLDANQAYSAKEAVAFLREIRRAGVRPTMIEQPVGRDDLGGLAAVTRAAGIPVCADESARDLAAVRRLIRRRAVTAVNVKTMKSGILPGADIVRLARRHGLKLMIGAMLESSLSSTASAHLAAGLGGFDWIDLDTPFFVRGDVRRNPFLSSRGEYDVGPCRAGIGIVAKSNVTRRRSQD